MVYILLENGFEECEAITPADILRRGGISVSLVGVSDACVTGRSGISVMSDEKMGALSDDAELLIIPGGQPAVDVMWENERVHKLVQNAAERKLPIAAICAAPIILARLGVLDGRRAVCHPSYRDELSAANYIENTGVVRDGEIITARAAGDSMAFAFEILEYLRGKEVRDKVAADICHE